MIEILKTECQQSFLVKYIADIKSNSVFSLELIELCNMNDLCFIDKSMLLFNTFTYGYPIIQRHSWTIV